MNLITNEPDMNDMEEVLFDPHSKFGKVLADTIAAPNSDPLEILISLEDLVIEQFGEVVLRAHKAHFRVRVGR